MELGDRMKMYERQEIDRILMPGLPAIVRLDGRAFHTFTKGLEKPYDFSLIELMSEVAKSLVEETNALVGYTQSDEISLVLWNEDPKVQPLTPEEEIELRNLYEHFRTAHNLHITDKQIARSRFLEEKNKKWEARLRSLENEASKIQQIVSENCGPSFLHRVTNEKQ